MNNHVNDNVCILMSGLFFYKRCFFLRDFLKPFRNSTFLSKRFFSFFFLLLYLQWKPYFSLFFFLFFSRVFFFAFFYNYFLTRFFCLFFLQMFFFCFSPIQDLGETKLLICCCFYFYALFCFCSLSFIIIFIKNDHKYLIVRLQGLKCKYKNYRVSNAKLQTQKLK